MYNIDCSYMYICTTLHLYTTEQAYYLEYLDVSDGAEEIEPCDDGCSSSEIALPFNFPFGNYYHRSAYVRQTHRKNARSVLRVYLNHLSLSRLVPTVQSHLGTPLGMMRTFQSCSHRRSGHTWSLPSGRMSTQLIRGEWCGIY